MKGYSESQLDDLFFKIIKTENLRDLSEKENIPYANLYAARSSKWFLLRLDKCLKKLNKEDQIQLTKAELHSTVEQVLREELRKMKLSIG